MWSRLSYIRVCCTSGLLLENLESPYQGNIMFALLVIYEINRINCVSIVTIYDVHRMHPTGRTTLDIGLFKH